MNCRLSLVCGLLACQFSINCLYLFLERKYKHFDLPTSDRQSRQDLSQRILCLGNYMCGVNSREPGGNVVFFITFSFIDIFPFAFRSLIYPFKVTGKKITVPVQ